MTKLPAFLLAVLLCVGNAFSQESAPIEPDPFVESIQDAYTSLESGEGLPAEVPRTTPRESVFGKQALLKAVFSLCVVLALMFLVIALLRRFSNRIPALAGNDLGSVMGRIFLERNVSLHFVRVQQHVLVVGVNAGSIAPIATLPLEIFSTLDLPDAEESKPVASGGDAFLGHLQAAANPDEAGPSTVSDAEVDRLRSDIHRLQKFIQEEARGRNDS